MDHKKYIKKAKSSVPHYVLNCGDSIGKRKLKLVTHVTDKTFWNTYESFGITNNALMNNDRG